MLDFFAGIGKAVLYFLRYLWSIIQNTLTAIGYLVSSVGLVAFLSGYMPTIFAGVILASSAVLVVKFIFGR